MLRRLLLPVAALALLAALPACGDRRPAAPASSASAVIPVPPELTAALAAYRAAGPKGWAYTQSTSGSDKNLVERFDPRLRGPERWALLQQDGRTPTEDELREYRQASAAKSDGDTASSVRDQLDLASCSLVAEDERTATYQFSLVPATKADTAAVHMHARFTLDRPAGVITRMELFNFEPFGPVTSLKIDEARTTMRYSLPAEGRPSLLEEITLKLRGRRLWVRSFSQDMTVRYTDHVDAAAPSATPPAAEPSAEPVPQS